MPKPTINKIVLNSLKNFEVAADVASKFVYQPHQLLYKNVFDEYQIRKNSLDVAIHRSLKAGWVEKVNKEGKIYLKLTTSGHSKLISLGALTQDEWDGIWRIVVFDIPEKFKGIRNKLRRNLKVLGFIPWQKSVWISPLPHEREVTRFLKENNLESSVVVLKTREILAEDADEFKEFVKDKLATNLRPADW